jgi:signal peptidase complex subunit 1
MVDYRGQKLCENIYYFLTIFFGAIAWIVGAIYGDFWMTFYGWLVGLVLALIVCIPDWPIFNKHEVKWLDHVGQYSAQSSSSSKPKETKKDKKKKN